MKKLLLLITFTAVMAGLTLLAFADGEDERPVYHIPEDETVIKTYPDAAEDGMHSIPGREGFAMCNNTYRMRKTLSTEDCEFELDGETVSGRVETFELCCSSCGHVFAEVRRDVLSPYILSSESSYGAEGGYPSVYFSIHGWAGLSPEKYRHVDAEFTEEGGTIILTYDGGSCELEMISDSEIEVTKVSGEDAGFEVGMRLKVEK